MKILVADDNVICRKVLAGILAAYGQCDSVVDGKEVLEAVTRACESGQPYELICLDLGMPVVDGHEALLGIRRLEAQRQVSPDKAAKIVMVTGSQEPELVEQLFKEGCDQYIVKPFDKKILQANLEKVGVCLPGR